KRPSARAEFSPLSGQKAKHRQSQRMRLLTGVGEIAVKVWYGLDRGRGQWGSPMRQRWGLRPHQRTSPLLEDKLAFTVTATGSYQEAAAVAQKWGTEVDDSTLHVLSQRLGERA